MMLRLLAILFLLSISNELFAQQVNDTQSTVANVPFVIERDVVLRRAPDTKDGSYWIHPRAALIPATALKDQTTPAALMVLFKFLGRSDFYSGVYTMRSDDLGQSWKGPQLETELDWVSDGEVNIAVADVTPGWHGPSKKLIAIGARIRYSPKGKQLEDQPRAHQTSYTVFDPATGKWEKWRRLEMPKGVQFNFARCACAQWLVEEDGSLLLPCYIGPKVGVPFSSTMVRASFDGDQLRYVEHGDVLALPVKRGLYEPSLVRFEGRYFLTMRNDLQAYCSVSDDGLKFEPVRKWKFDDGEILRSYNTQAHWVTLGDGLFLVYTRAGADNDHVVRHRAPLFIAQVDPRRMVVIRATEKILVPERGATLGNSGVTVINSNESWVTVAEANVDRPEAMQRGADGSVYVVKVKAAK
ncbi:glycoside hydrolase [bacterium]|nr:glycoside hydrolase [bacterium]